ncbi:MAG TPA: hypothetical protein VN698_11910 [Bacteroidia bacterium]|nr:hypothetical protein [Bacteroidia bacterium]
MKMNKTRFSVVGSGYFIKMFDMDHPLYLKVQGMDAATIYEIATNPDAFAKLKMTDSTGRPYNSFHEIMATEIFPVYVEDAFTRLEIKPSNTEKRIKLMLKDIERTDYLFVPEYIQNKTTLLQNKGLMVAEFDKGHFGTTIHPVEFKIGDTINFESVWSPQLKQKCIKSITVNGNEVRLKRPDTVNLGTQVFII